MITMPQAIAIVGAGLSGTLTAIHLLSHATSPLTIHLIDQTARFGPGLAYNPPSDAFKLNVRAKAMGAIPSDPEGFLRWLQKRRPSTKPDEFVPRALYGEYLRELLIQSESLARTHTLNRISNEVVDVQKESSRSLSVTLKDGANIHVDACVLALGNIPRVTLRGASGLATLRPPFQPASYTDIAHLREIFILGSSLTAVDVILECERRGFTGKYTVLSRHGRFPLPHEESSTSATLLPSEWYTYASTSKLLELIRAESKRLHSSQPVFEAMRPHIQEMWRHLPLTEKRRFLRHLQPIWEIHRHRIPVEHHNTLSALKDTNRLAILAGSFASAEPDGGGILIQFSPRGGPSTRRNFDAGFLCVGPEGDLSKVASPLVQNLLHHGSITAGPLKLGVMELAPPFWMIGPLQRESLWEITAARELREEAARVADEILSLL